MAAWIALLRGVNVGGVKVAMAELKAMAADMGLENPVTLLQSGNLVFSAAGAAADLEAKLEQTAAKTFRHDIDVMVRSAKDWAGIIARNPFCAMARDDPAHLQVMICKKQPDPEGLRALKAWDEGPEEIADHGRELYVTYPEGIGRSKLNGFSAWKKLKTPVTGRNWNTVLRLADLAGRQPEADAANS